MIVNGKEVEADGEAVTEEHWNTGVEVEGCG